MSKPSKTTSKTRSATSQALMNLRACSIVMVVSFHSALAYLVSQPSAAQSFDSPPYYWIATPILDSARWGGFDLYAAFLYVSLMPVFFFLSGIFVWPSLERRGSLSFLSGRLLRIGLPFLLGVYLWMPFAYYAVYRITATDPSWTAFLHHMLALPFWPSGPLWFLWELLLFDMIALALFQFVPRAGEALGRLSAAATAPGRYFSILVGVSVVAYVPLAFIFGVQQWREFGPFALQPDRILLYLVYFFAGVGIGVSGYDRGLLRADGPLVRAWRSWLAGAVATFVLWMISMAPAFFGHGGTLVDLISYLAVVLAVATACLAFVAVFLRFATARWPLADSLAENAYAIYFVHYVFVVWMQYLLLPEPWPAVAKAVVVFAVALALSWAIAVVSGHLHLPAWPNRDRRAPPGWSGHKAPPVA